MATKAFLCPCGCGREVPHGHFYANGKACYKRAHKQGIHMPKRYEAKNRMALKSGMWK